MRFADLLDVALVRKLADANYRASGMPIGIIDAVDGAVLVGFGWQDICTLYHRANPISAERCRESDDHVKHNLSRGHPCEYTCKNGLRDIGVPIEAGGAHLATLFLGQFFYEGESPDRAFFIEQARMFGFDEVSYLAALDRVPVFTRAEVENIVSYNTALATFLSDMAEAALRRGDAERQARELARFPQENPDPVLRLAPDLTVAYANDAALSQLAGLGVVAGAPASPPLAELARRARASGRRADQELAVGERMFTFVAVAIGDEVNAYAHDITARAAAGRALRDASRAKDEFLGMLSHELRNPLAPIRTALYVLEHAEPSGQQARRAREVAGRQLTHLTRIVDDLLDVTRIVRGKVELRRAELDVADLARRTGEDHRALMHERGILFEVDAPADGAWVDGDETRLAQVIGNLLQNAAKFTPAGGRVSLAVVVDGDAVVLCVADTGSGIEKELLERIFEPFVQEKQSLARTEGGLGLGLALVKGLVVLHGGRIEASSEGRGRGARFTVRLPVLRPERVAELRGAAVTEAAAPPRRRVLVVDDNQDAAVSLADLVQLYGHEVQVAFDGSSALEMAARTLPDVVLCDIGLPGMSGYDVARALRSDRRYDRVHLVAVSGYAQPEDRQRALDAGFEEHVAKPPDPDQVLRAVTGDATAH